MWSLGSLEVECYLKEELIAKLNAAEPAARLDALRELARMHQSGIIERPATGINVNNHIHTTYSFSPYSPAKAVYLAWINELATAGIMDHDSVSGAGEFIEAGEIVGMPVTVGYECRCSVAGTALEGRRLNNPDQVSVAYVAMHAIPHNMLGEAETFLAPYREKRNIRNRRMTEKLNRKLISYGMAIGFDRDILPISLNAKGGSVTERHILYALASAITEDEMQRYFLLGVFKSQLLESIYVDAADELPRLSGFISLAERLGAIPAYAYLGDVGASVTGDKKTQEFEDAFLDELLAYLAQAGIRAVTYMPARNSVQQLARIKALCEANGLFQISGEDINSPLQRFVCEKIETPEFRRLIESAWALIGHERAASYGVSKGMFSPETIARTPNLDDRVRMFAEAARQHNTVCGPPGTRD